MIVQDTNSVGCTHQELTGPNPPPAPTYLGNLLMSTKLSCCCGVWLVDNLHGSESTWRPSHREQWACFSKGWVKILKNENDSEILLTFSRNNESTPRYLDTMYRHRRWRSIPEPVMARRYMFWCLSAAFRNRASLWAFWPKTQTRVISFCWCQFNPVRTSVSRVQDAVIRLLSSREWPSKVWTDYTLGVNTHYKCHW